LPSIDWNEFQQVIGSVGVLGRSREKATHSIPDEDALAYCRDPDEFRSTSLAKAPNGDFAQTMIRLLMAVTVRLAVFTRLRQSRDPVLAAIAGRTRSVPRWGAAPRRRPRGTRRLLFLLPGARRAAGR
jgi:1,2-phenylacetyl-CoA epoxidase catalytic subunit